MSDPVTATLIAGAITAGGAVAAAEISKPDSPSALAPPDQINQEAIAAATRRRVLSRSGRPSTLLTDDTETPAARQIPSAQIGRATLLGN